MAERPKPEYPFSAPLTPEGETKGKPPATPSLPGMASPLQGGSRPSLPGLTPPPSARSATVPPVGQPPIPMAGPGQSSPSVPGQAHPPGAVSFPPQPPRDASTVTILEEQTRTPLFQGRSLPLAWIVGAAGVAFVAILLLVVTAVFKPGDESNATQRAKASGPKSRAEAMVDLQTDAQNFSKALQAWTQMKQIWMGLEMYASSEGEGQMPDTLEDLFRSQGLPGSFLKDPWGQWIDYDPDEPRVTSSGVDLRLGTDDDLILTEDTMNSPPPFLLEKQEEMARRAQNMLGGAP